MKKEAGSFLDDAENDLKDLLKLLQDEDDRCVGKVSARVELAREALGGSLSLETIDDTRDRVDATREASRKCGNSLGRDVNKSLDRVTKSLNRAARVLQ
jgi:O-succinylbenzoate synthase